MEQNVIYILITIIVYLVSMIVIGIICSKKNNNVGDFYLGGRKLGPFVTAMSAEASDMSSYLLMGLPGLAYLTGMADVGWTVVGLTIGTYLNWLIVAKRLRIYSSINQSITIPEFLSNRYRDEKHIITCISAIVILIFFVPYTASGFAACGKLFTSLFGIDYHISMIVSAIVIVAYTSIGGFLAASTTDFIQSIMMSVALLIIVIFGINTAGGFENVIDNVKSLEGYFSLVTTHNNDTGTAQPYTLLNIISTVAWGLGYFGMPHILLRFMATEDKNKIKLSRRIATVWVIISMVVAVFIGMIGRTLSAHGIVEELLTSSDSETIIVKMAELLSKNSIIAAVLAGLIFAGILACTMSTSDSQLLVASSSMSEDILKSVFKMNLSEKASMIVARGVLLVISAISIIIAWNPDSSVFYIVSFAWAGFGATFGPLMLTSLFWKRTNKYGAIAGLISGGLMVFIWKFIIRPFGGAWNIYELLPAFIISLLCIVIVSLVTPAPNKEITDEFELVKNTK